MAKQKTDISSVHTRPPVVAVLGHVDHGKTTLLDYIRKTKVASSEHGGITQHIGAYQIEYRVKGKEQRYITFIDTPGHEAFSKIRSRGASAADIAILVVAADDSVKPQTIESIEQIKNADVSLVVAINKIDAPGAMVDKVKSDLAKVGVQLEGFGGDVPFVAISAKEGTGVEKLLDLLVLVADMQKDRLVVDPGGAVSAVVIEAKIDKFRGMTATLLIKQGTLTARSSLYEGQKLLGRVRAMNDEYGKRVNEAPPGKPVEVMGFSKLPSVGAVLTSEAAAIESVQEQVQASGISSAEEFLQAMTESEKQKLKIYLKADTSGSLEAVVEALSKAETDIVSTGIGDITEADVLEAKAMGAVVIGFNVKAGATIEKLARVEKVVYRTYTIIYKLIEEMEDVIAGMEELIREERELGRGVIIAEFPFDRERILGIKVASGRLAKGDSVRIVRNEEEVGKARIKSVHQGKNEVNRVAAGGECGILLDKPVDFLPQDDIIAYTTG